MAAENSVEAPQIVSENQPMPAEEFSPDALLEKLVEGNQQFATGWTPSTGIWVISLQDVPINNGLSETEAADIAMLRAKEQIASFMGSSVEVQEELLYEEKTVGDQVEITEFFKSINKIDVNQFLRGVTVFNQEIHDGRLCAAFYATGKLMDASKALEEQLRAEPPGVVRAVGFALIKDNKLAIARQTALQNALRNAVEQVMGTSLVGQSQLMDNTKVKSKVISHTVGNIKQYRIVKEAEHGINYQVIADVQVDEKSIIDNYAAIVRSMGNPEFFIKTTDPDLRTALNQFMAGLGFLVTLDKTAADFIINADCQYINISNDHYGDGIQIDTELSLLAAEDNQQFFTFCNTPRLTSTYSGDFHQIRQVAAQKAFKSMKKQLHENLNKVVMDWVLNGHTVEVVFTGVNSDQQFLQILSEAISGVPCVQVIRQSIQGDVLIFTCSYIGIASDFAEFLMERLRKDLPQGLKLPEVKKIEFNQIELEF